MLIGQKLGSYSLEKELGSGAMGTVYRARNEKTGQRVAIKVLGMGLGHNQKARDRFEREIAVLQQLNHPNIVRYINHGRFEGTEYVAMEFVDGETLDSTMHRRGGRFPWQEIVGLGQQICAALQHAHHQGIIHRDLKPSNLMITRDGTLKLTDFGIAKDLDQSQQLTSAHCTVGTAAYMSPEQCKGEKQLTHRSDLYSLGVVLYELLTGQKPFKAETAMEMFMQHTQGTFERPARLALDIPVWLDNLVCQLLAKKPEERGFDAAVVGEALSRVVDKVSAQDSAGVDAAKTRVMDRLLDRTRVDDVKDKKAARTLLTSMQSRRKRREKALWEKTWFQASAFSTGLLALAIVLFFVFRPVSDEQLYQDTLALVKGGDLDSRLKARTGPLEKYLARYPEPQDERGREMHRLADEIDREELVHAWKNRMRINFSPEDAAEQAYRTALRAEDDGALTQAASAWAALEEASPGTTREMRIRRFYAAERRKDVQAALTLEGELRKSGLRDSFRHEAQRQAVFASKFEEFNDKHHAHQCWLSARAAARSEADLQPWALLAAKRARELRPLPPDDPQQRFKLVQRLLKEGQVWSDKDEKQARARLEDIRDLYNKDNDPAVRELVKKAVELLKGLGSV